MKYRNHFQLSVATAIMCFIFMIPGCKKEAKENQLPTVSITSPAKGATLTFGSTVIISAEADDEDGSIAEVRFYVDGVGLSSATSFPYNYSWSLTSISTGNHAIKVTAKDNDGAVQTTEISVTLKAAGSAPVAAFTANTTNITAGSSVSFTDQSENEPTSWNWNFGDGTTHTVQNPTHNYAEAGTYTVSLKVTNNYGNNTSTKNNYITVTTIGTAPIAAFTANTTNITAGGSVSFTDQSTNAPTSWLWTFGDGGSSTQQNPTHSYNSAGTFTVTLKATNTFGNNTATKSNYVTVTPAGTAPVAAFIANTTSITTGSSVSFTDQSTNTPTSWLWNFGDGATSTEQNPTHNYSATGTFTVTLKATNSFGNNTATKSNYITVTPAGSAPVAAFTANATSITAGESVSFTDQSTNTPTSWLWNFGDGGSSTQQNPIRNYSAAGTYTVSLQVTNTFGNNTATKSNYITVTPAGSAPVADFIANTTSVPAGGSISFTDKSSNYPISWYWNFGDGSSSTQQNPTHTYNSAGSYTVSLNVNNGYGSDLKTEVNFIIITPKIIYGTLVDIEGHSYKTVIIGTQTWMAQNLRVTTLNDGTSILRAETNADWVSAIENTPAYCWFDNNSSNASLGALYNSKAVVSGNLCPLGWHVPSDDEWTTLEVYLISNGYNYDGTVDNGGDRNTNNKIAKSIASISMVDECSSSVVGAPGNNDYPEKRNITGFSAVRVGRRYSDGRFMDLGWLIWWTSGGYYTRAISCSSVNVVKSQNTAGTSSGSSVRCIRD
jgi:uncharacterized protein (TIGR02145 family)